MKAMSRHKGKIIACSFTILLLATYFACIKDQRTLLKGFHHSFQLAKPGADFLRVFLLTRIFLFQCAILREQLGMLCSFISAQR